MNKNNLADISLYFEYSKNYFYVVKLKSPEKFKYIRLIDTDNFFNAYVKYLEEMENIKFKLQDIYYYLEDHKLIKQFSIYAKENGLFKNDNNLSTKFKEVIFSNTQGFHFHSTYIKYSKLINLFNKFIQERN